MKYFFSIILTSLSTVISAQGYKKFSVRIGGGSSFATNYYHGSGSGFALVVEPSLRVKANSLIGLRCEGAYNVFLSSGSCSLFGQYSFRGNTVQAFIGLGGGFYRYFYFYALNHGNDNTVGFYPRFGVSYHQFSLVVDWNITLPKREMLTDFISPGVVRIYSGDINCSYLAIKGCIVLGRSRKK